jgi:hypothetical protein
MKDQRDSQGIAVQKDAPCTLEVMQHMKTVVSISSFLVLDENRVTNIHRNITGRHYSAPGHFSAIGNDDSAFGNP